MRDVSGRGGGSGEEIPQTQSPQLATSLPVHGISESERPKTFGFSESEVLDHRSLRASGMRENEAAQADVEFVSVRFPDFDLDVYRFRSWLIAVIASLGLGFWSLCEA